MRKKQEAYKHVSLEHQERVLDMIRSQIGKPCPTNTEISADLGIKNGVISNAISALVARKILSRTIGNGERTLTITETGQATLPGPARDLAITYRMVDKQVARDGTTGKSRMYQDANIRLVLKPA